MALSMKRKQEIRLQVEAENAPKTVALALLSYDAETPAETLANTLEHYGVPGVTGRLTNTVKKGHPVAEFSGRAADVNALVAKYNAESNLGRGV